MLLLLVVVVVVVVVQLMPRIIRTRFAFLVFLAFTRLSSGTTATYEKFLR